MSIEELKKKIGYFAAEFVEDGMLVGLGTGSTAFFFIERLIQRCREGLTIQAVASSTRSSKQARDGGIPLLDVNQITHLDLTVDGADQIDRQKRMIKGGGGAHVREKIVANMSRELIIIIDESKLVDQLGKISLPVEVLPFGIKATLHQIEKSGYKGKLRLNPDQSLFISDNGNHIFDIHLPHFLSNPEQDHLTIRNIPGVVDTGFFFQLAGRVVVGFLDGQIAIRP